MQTKPYIVQKGDSLFQIGRRLGVVPEGIYLLNRLTSDELQIGQMLRIPSYVEAQTVREDVPVYRWEDTNGEILGHVNAGTRFQVMDTTEQFLHVVYLKQIGYLYRKDAQILVYDDQEPIISILGYYTQAEGELFPSSEKTFIENTDVLTQTALFFWRLDPSSPVLIENSANASPQYIEGLVWEGHRSNVRMQGVIHNLMYKEPGDSAQTVEIALANAERRQALVESILDLVRAYHLDGINLDLEDLYPKDQRLLNIFLELLHGELHEIGADLTVCLPLKMEDEEGEFDYASIGDIADTVVIMMYNEHGWPGSGPGPVSSSTWMRRVLEGVLPVIPAKKILAAVGLFGFDFNLTKETVQYLSYMQARERMKYYRAQAEYDSTAQSWKFTYTDENGDQHEVWYDDGTSIVERAKIADEYGIQELALWRLGLGDPQSWQDLRTQVVVRKG